LKNEHLAGDLTNINRLVPPDKSVPQHVWKDEFTAELKRRIEEVKQEFQEKTKKYSNVE